MIKFRICFCREAFSGFDAEVVAKFTEKKMTSLSANYAIDLSQVRGIVDNSIRILEVINDIQLEKFLECTINLSFELRSYWIGRDFIFH